MKKNYLLGTMAAGMLLFTACSNDKDIENVSGNDDATQAFVLKVASSGAGVTTRAGRPLESSEAKQQIDNVKIIVCNEYSEVRYVETVTDWNHNGSEIYETGGHGREKTIEIPKEQKLEPGIYRVYAFGYIDGSKSDYNLTPITDIADGTAIGEFNSNIVLSFKKDAGNRIGEEIFAGESSAFEVRSGKGFRTQVVLNRQVAGTFGYVKDIPFVEDGTKLRLIAAAKNNQLVLGQFESYDLPENGTGNEGHINYVVNGAFDADADAEDVAEEDKMVIYEIFLDEWFNEIKDDDDNGIIDIGDNWIGNSEKYVVGSVFAGEFLIPFLKVDSKNTFTLQLTNADNEVLQDWTVKLPEDDDQTLDYSLYYWNSTEKWFFLPESMRDTNPEYNVVRNHLYGIGKKTLDKPGYDPGPDTDKPASLNTKQELILRVNDSWEVVHSMDIE